MDQTDLGDRFAVLMISVRCGDRSLPLVWQIETGEANIGFSGQQALLQRVRAWLPEGVAVMLLADRFYPSAASFEWLIAAGWLIWYPKNGRHEVWYFDLVEVGHEESESELHAGVSGGGSAAGDRRWAEHSGGGTVVGDVGEDVGELGVAGAQGRPAGQGVGRTAGE